MEPLSQGAEIAGRYRVTELLGRGGFGYTYRAFDTAMDRDVVVKELCPRGAVREGEFLRLEGSEHLQHRFLRDAKAMARLRIDGVAQVHDGLRWNGTAYVVMEYLPDCTRLADEIRRRGKFEPERARAILLRLCETLQEVHEQGMLHRDLKPSNILLLPGDRPALTDFGGAREWHADAAPSDAPSAYAPLERASAGNQRGPEADVYSLAACGYEMLTGVAPTPAIKRLDGTPLVPLQRHVESVPADLATAIETGLALDAWERPASMREWAQSIEGSTDEPQAGDDSEIETYDRKLLELQKLKFGKQECPACNGLLETAKPLKKGRCPVCRLGRLERLELDGKRCPICRTGVWKRLANASPIKICPMCGEGRLKKKGVLGKTLRCSQCSAAFGMSGSDLTLLESGGSERARVGDTGDSDSFWLPLSGRSSDVTYCETCRAEWDAVANGDLRLVVWRDDPFGVAKRHRTLSREEWARVALRRSPDSGNVACARCDADFYSDDESLTLLDADRDPFGFRSRYLGRRLPMEALPFLGAGKASGRDGCACAECGTEFDEEGDYLRLRNTRHATLRKHMDTARPLEDWHRIARGLPPIDEEAQWLEAFESALRDALVTGEISWADRKRPSVRWFSEAERVGFGRGRALIHEGTVTFDARRGGWSVPLDAVRSVSVEGEEAVLVLVGEAEPVRLRLGAERVSLDLASGKRVVVLTAEDFVRALQA